MKKVTVLLNLLNEQESVPKEETIVIKVVDATKVRDKAVNGGKGDIEFTMDGHYYRYKFVPENEIWLAKMNKEDTVATEVHSFAERIMQKYYGIDYDVAHEEIANKCEEVIRDFIRSKGLSDKEKGGE